MGSQTEENGKEPKTVRAVGWWQRNTQLHGETRQLEGGTRSKARKQYAENAHQIVSAEGYPEGAWHRRAGRSGGRQAAASSAVIRRGPPRR